MKKAGERKINEAQDKVDDAKKKYVAAIGRMEVAEDAMEVAQKKVVDSCLGNMLSF